MKAVKRQSNGNIGRRYKGWNEYRSWSWRARAPRADTCHIHSEWQAENRSVLLQKILATNISITRLSPCITPIKLEILQWWIFGTMLPGTTRPPWQQSGIMRPIQQMNYLMIFNGDILWWEHMLFHMHCISAGMVQAWVGHFVTPLKRRSDKFDWRVKSQKPHKKHKYLTNTITMVMELPTPPAAWFFWIHAAGGAGGLPHIVSNISIKAIY